MALPQLEHPFDGDRGTEPARPPVDTPGDSETLSGREALLAQRRAAARASGRHPTPQTDGRSRNMRAIRRTDTKPEVALRSALHRAGYRFRKDYRFKVGDTWVRPDIVFTRRRVAVFVDGCFWHSCPMHGRRPHDPTDYWRVKLARNVERDKRDEAILKTVGWRVIRVWEHESIPDVVATLERKLGSAGIGER